MKQTTVPHQMIVMSLWHIPTSSLLLQTGQVDEMQQHVDGVRTTGIDIRELMLHVEYPSPGAGHVEQFFGDGMLSQLQPSR